jgi:hypothetical protein
MSLLLAKNNTPSYLYYSNGDETAPVTATADLTNTGGTITSATDNSTYVIATGFNYTDISISVVNEVAGIDWQLSTDNSTWLETITISDMDALVSDQTTQIHARATFDNDGSIATGKHIEADIRITSIERPV